MGLSAYPHFCLYYGGMFPMTYLAVLMQSYVFSGKEKDVDFLLLKAKSLARAKTCSLYDGDEASGWISWRYDQFFEDGMWMTPHSDVSAANYKQMSEEVYDCIIQCFAADENAKWLTGIGPRDGCALIKKLHASKGPSQHQMGKQDMVLERLTLVTMRGWPEYRDKFREAMEARNNVVGMSFSEKLSDATLFRKFYMNLSTVFYTVFQTCVTDTCEDGAPESKPVESVIKECDALYEISILSKSGSRMATHNVQRC
jgi:hypothetical protein